MDDPARVDAALAATRHAYRDSTRLPRLLSAVEAPVAAAELVDRTLLVLSDVFSTEVACVVRRVGSRLVVTHACGSPVGGSWPLGPAALEAATRGLGVARGPVERADLPPAVDALTIRSGAWVPLSASDSLLILLRRGGAFRPTDLQVLGATVNRMHATLARRERDD